MEKKTSRLTRTVSMIILAVMISLPVYSATERIIPPIPETITFNIQFNGDYLKGYCLVLDFRTPEEKKRDTDTKSLAGNIILFSNGHSQRADSGYAFTSKLAALSKSGIVLVPICDTPFGEQSKWRGDNGKDVIMMEITKYILGEMNIAVKNYKPLTDLKVKINKKEIPAPSADAIQAELSAIGWSHGAALSRRLTSLYPDSVTSLVQVTPGGFVEWGGEYCSGPSCLMTNFLIESTFIGGGFFRGEGSHVLDASWGVFRGMGGDSFRSCSSCIFGNFSLLKPFRTELDTMGCALYVDDKNFPVTKAKSITVIFGDNDFLFEYDDDAGIKNPEKVTQEEHDKFFEKFYPAAIKSGAKCTLAALPGNHIAPSVNNEKFADMALSTIDQKK